jgi:hypothetical protein
MGTYYLMHKDQACGMIVLDDVTGNVLAYKNVEAELTPFLGNASIENIKKWWMNRAIPANRDTIKALINSLEISTSEEYLAKNLALSVTDTYWICPVGAELKYEDINFFNLRSYNDGKIPYHNNTSYDPNASLGGQMEKYWDLNGETPALIKESYKYYGQQSINEAFASYLFLLQNNDIRYVRYKCDETQDGGKSCSCEAFTSKDVELISAYEVLSSSKTANDKSNYESYIDICAKCGIDRDIMQDFMDYQTAVDFIISNTDEHLNNFGVLRDANTMELIGPAPIFDSGNSMFYSDLINRPFTRVEMMGRELTAFHKSEEKMLAHIKNRSLVKIDLLPTPGEVKEFYCKNGVPEKRAELIAENYYTKLKMFKEFQKGATLSLFNEKKLAGTVKN